MQAAELELRAAEVFKAALDHKPGQWPEFLQHACGRDAPLRATVESLLGGIFGGRWLS